MERPGPLAQTAGNECPGAVGAPSPEPGGLWYLGWALAWLGIFGIFRLLLTPAGFGSYGRSWVAGLFYLCAAAAVWVGFRHSLRQDLRAPRPARLGLLLALGLVAWSAALVCARLWPIDDAVLRRFAGLQLGVVQMNGRYFRGKLPEILFQQSMILLLVRHLQQRGVRRLCCAFALLFGAIHLPLLVLKGLLGVPFVLAASLLGCVFPYCILRWEQGWLVAYAAHVSAYLVVGVWLRACVV